MQWLRLALELCLQLTTLTVNNRRLTGAAGSCTACALATRLGSSADVCNKLHSKYKANRQDTMVTGIHKSPRHFKPQILHPAAFLNPK